MFEILCFFDLLFVLFHSFWENMTIISLKMYCVLWSLSSHITVIIYMLNYFTLPHNYWIFYSVLVLFAFFLLFQFEYFHCSNIKFVNSFYCYIQTTDSPPNQVSTFFLSCILIRLFLNLSMPTEILHMFIHMFVFSTVPFSIFYIVIS